MQRLLALPTPMSACLGLPDQHAVEHLDRLEAEAAGLLDGVTEVYVTAWEGGHPDHDAMNLVAARLRARGDGAEAERATARMAGRPPAPAPAQSRARRSSSSACTGADVAAWQ